MLEFYQLRNIKRQTLQSDEVRRHEIIHVLGYHASIYKKRHIKTKSKLQKYQHATGTSEENTGWYKAIAQINCNKSTTN